MYSAIKLNELFAQMSPDGLAKTAKAIDDEYEYRCIGATQQEQREIARCRTEIANHFLCYADPQEVYDRCHNLYHGAWES